MFSSLSMPLVKAASSSYGSLYTTYPTASSSSGSGAMFTIFVIVFLLIYIAAWAVAMQLITMAAREKGYSAETGKLWFIGLLVTPICPAVIVAALPDKKLQKAISEEAAAAAVDSELPSL